MKAIEKLNLLADEQLNQVKGGMESLDLPTLYGIDRNSKKNCTCSGSGDNLNSATGCHCTDNLSPIKEFDTI